MHRARAARAYGASVIAGLTAILTVTAALAGCSSSSPPVSSSPGSQPAPTTAPSTTRPPATTTPTSAPPTPTPSTSTPPTSAPPAPAAVPFTGTIAPLLAADVPFTYHAGCPVGPSQLRELHLTYWGFDDRSHAGTMVVAATVATKVVDVFRLLYAVRFPIREMEPEDVFGGHDPASMAADNTSGFNCRDAVAPGPPQWSAHAFGTAIDVNPVENPYIEGGAVQPAAGSAFLDRARVRPGMSGPDTVLNRAFAAVGWQWGGRWTSAPDYQHFSADGG